MKICFFYLLLLKARISDIMRIRNKDITIKLLVIKNNNGLSHKARSGLSCAKYSINRSYCSDGSTNHAHCDHLPAYYLHPARYLSANKYFNL